MSDGPSETKMRRAECGRCGGTRNCLTRGHFSERGGDEHYQWHTQWYILQCAGCDYVFAYTIASNSEDVDYGYNEIGEEEMSHKEVVSCWPPISGRPKPEWMAAYGVTGISHDELDQALVELYRALDSDMPILATICVRTVFDIASELLGVDGTLRFNEKLNDLVARGHIAQVDRTRVEALIEAGNAAAHRGWRPKAADVSTLVETLETFIHDAFVAPSRKIELDAKTAALLKKVPPRNKKKNILRRASLD